MSALRIVPENMTRRELARAVAANAIVQTERGEKPLASHLRQERRGAPTLFELRHGIVYRCRGCGRLTCMCNGGSPDERCDACVVGGAA